MADRKIIQLRLTNDNAIYHAADPALVRQITVKDFNKFHDRFIPGQNLGLLSGKRAETAQSGMLVAR